MKSILVISLVTFVLIFGSVVLVSTQLNKVAVGGVVPELAPDDYEAAERVFADMDLERDRLQQEREDTIALRQALVVQEQVLIEGREQLQGVIKQLESKQQEYVAERDRSAAKLAKMYEAMKPAQAAPIMSALDLDIILDIMGRMKERPAAKIMAYMDAGLAAQISTRMSIKGGS